MAHEPLVEKINDRADRRGAANAFVGDQPEHTQVVLARRKAADQVRVRIGDDARQDGNSEP